MGRLGLKPRPYLLLFSSFFWGGLSPAQPAWIGFDSASPARSLAQASHPVGQQARVVQTTRALHRAKVIKLHSPCFLILQQEMQKQKENEGLTWRWRRRRRRPCSIMTVYECMFKHAWRWMQHIGYGFAFWEGDIIIAILWTCGQIRIRYAVQCREEICWAFCHLSFQPCIRTLWIKNGGLGPFYSWL
jgi:hypothetical protein